MVKTLCSHGSQSQTQRDFLHQCEGFAAGELKHGTIALIEEGTPVLALFEAVAHEKRED